MADRKRPKQYRSEQMVRDIVTATANVVSEVGVHGATVDKIATEAGVSPGSIYQYFSTKQNVLGDFAINEFEGLRQVSLQSLVICKDLPMRDLIRKVIDLMIEAHLQRPKTTEQIYRHVSDLGALEEQMRRRRETIAAVSGLFRSRQKELKIADPDKAAAAIIHAMTGIISAPYVDEKLPYSVVELRDEMVAMAEGYLLGDIPPQA